mmetsp:Transcript_65247/g.103391  ORF Transcript_65247/g.103391 Transcript_65247/m.103391 type:complete len:188 (-) Transcript_65247:41-604(-)
MSGKGVASTVGSYAASGAKAGASAAQKGFVTIATAVVQNPVCVKVFCFFVGLATSVFSVLYVINITGEEEQEPKEIVQCFFTFLFGLVIMICDGGETMCNSFIPFQKLLFKQCYFLATNTGRAGFYFYVGSIIAVQWPENDWWKIVFLSLGGSLAVLGLVMLILYWCPCCQPKQAADVEARGGSSSK